LKKQYGDRLAFMGNIDVMKMAHPDPKVIEEGFAASLRSQKSVADTSTTATTQSRPQSVLNNTAVSWNWSANMANIERHQC